jgi:single-stranded-DNA-specific exonuclease
VRAGTAIRRRDAHGAERLASHGMDPLLARIYAGRGVVAGDEVDHRLRHLLAPEQLGGIERAAELLADAIEAGRRIVVVGDFDCDGATGCAVGVEGLRLLGASSPRFAVPHRQLHGYGLGPALVDSLRALAPELIVTVDNGISSIAGVDAAARAGIPVLVTDHHLPGPELPRAAAIVDPNLPGDPFPSKALSGVGVMFYVLLATRARLRVRGWFGAARAEPDLAPLLDRVALGTVADLVPLDRNNRVLVEAGLRRIRAGLASIGVAALFEIAGRDPSAAVASDLGFAIAPRVNAAGRLEDMGLGIRCLLASDAGDARALAMRLDAINRERRELQGQMTDDARAILDGLGALEPDGGGVCLFDPGWHAGVVGLVASKMKERLARPVFAFARADDGTLRGSGRSVPGFHLRDALAEVDARHPGLIGRFGGHAMAAGLTLEAGALQAFGRAFAEVSARQLPDAARTTIWTDGELPAAEATLERAGQLRAAGPWGQGFPEPCFDGEFEVDDVRAMSGRHQRLRLRHVACGTAVDAVHFDGADAGPVSARVRAVYELAIDDWRGERRLRLFLRHREPA